MHFVHEFCKIGPKLNFFRDTSRQYIFCKKLTKHAFSKFNCSKFSTSFVNTLCFLHYRLFQSLIPNRSVDKEHVWKSIMASPYSGKSNHTWLTALKRVLEFNKGLQTLIVPEMDLKKSALGVLRLQELYELDTTDIRLGNIRKTLNGFFC